MYISRWVIWRSENVRPNALFVTVWERNLSIVWYVEYCGCDFLASLSAKIDSMSVWKRWTSSRQVFIRRVIHHLEVPEPVKIL